MCASVNDKDKDGEIPLHWVTVHGHSDVVRLLLEYPAEDGSNTAAAQCRARNKFGRTTLYYAAEWGHTDVCRILLEHGALVDDRDNDGDTPLHYSEKYAPQNVRKDAARFLSEYIAAHPPSAIPPEQASKT